MLRLVALALLLANLLYFGWTLGWLDGVVGIRAQGDREPQRLAQQVRPELIQLSAVADATTQAQAPAADDAASAPPNGSAQAAATPGNGKPTPAESQAAAAPASAPASAPVRTALAASAAASPKASEALACLEAGPFSAAELADAEAAIRKAVPAADWTQRRVAGSGEWMIYMGPYADDAWIERKKAELSRIRGGLSFEVVGPTSQFGRGISLGRFSSEADADKRLDQLRPRGIRTARVIKSGDGPAMSMLRVPKADPATAERLAGIEWPAGQNGFKPCPAPR